MATNREANQSVLFDYLAETILPILKRDGIWIAPNPAPLTAVEVVSVMETVVLHDNYRHQTLMTQTEDGFTVTVKDGIVSKER